MHIVKLDRDLGHIKSFFMKFSDDVYFLSYIMHIYIYNIHLYYYVYLHNICT